MPEAHATTSLVHDGFLLLGAAVVFVLLFRRLGLGATLGYLVAGAVMGPYVLGLVGDAEAKVEIAELGIVLLLRRTVWGEIGIAASVLNANADSVRVTLGNGFICGSRLEVRNNQTGTMSPSRCPVRAETHIDC